jgi:hypothetical protein
LPGEIKEIYYNKILNQFLYNRITIEEVGCHMILTHIKRREILNRLLVALDVTTDPNRSTNIAFAIARLMEDEDGKKILINDCGQTKFVSKKKIQKF